MFRGILNFFLQVLFIYSIFSSAKADERLEYPSQLPAFLAQGPVVKSLKYEECSKTENQIPPLIKHQDAFKHYKIFRDYNAQKILFEIGFRSCAVLRGWPQKVREALVEAASHDNLLLYSRNNWDYHYHNTLTPSWLPTTAEFSTVMWAVGTHRVAPKEMLGEYKKLCRGGMTNGGKQLSKREAIEFNASKGAATTDGTPISHKCFESESAVENDLLVKRLWKTLDVPDKNFSAVEGLQARYLATLKEAQAIAAYHEPILQMEEKPRGFRKKQKLKIE